jgi:hypothetical protein
VDKLAIVLKDDLYMHGVAVLATIAKEVGITKFSHKMQELMEERNKEIMLAFDNIKGDEVAFQSKVDEIVAKYRTLIVAEAQRFKDAGEKDTNPETGNGPSPSLVAGVPAPAPESKDGDGNMMVIVIGIVGGVIILALAGALGMVYKMGRAKGRKENPEFPASVGPLEGMEGDNNVVMGRPVEGNVDGTAAAQGAPVQGKGQAAEGGKGEKDNAV